MPLLRFIHIAYTLWRAGVVGLIAPVLPRKGLAGLVRWMASPGGLHKGQSPAEQLHHAAHREQQSAVKLRIAFEQLGPIFVKFGQMLSTRPDLLSPALLAELSKLQDRVPPFSAHQVHAQLQAAYGKPVGEVFTAFDDTPVASASIAQVHFGRALVDGAEKEVAIKILRPNMVEAIERDLAVMHTMAGMVARISADGERLKPREVVQEFDHHLHDELDLLREAANASQLRKNMAGLNLVQIPQMHFELCRPQVMVMERMHGIPINQHAALRSAGIDLGKLARDGVTIFFTQVFRDGFFHADMHPGNIMVSTAPATFGRFIALDFGIVGTLSEFDKEYLAHNFHAFFTGDYKRVAALHIESGWVPPTTRLEELEAAVRACCEPYFNRPLKDLSLGMTLYNLFNVSRRFNVQIQPQLVLLQKTLINIEGLGRSLDPDLDLWATAKPFLENWMNEQIGPKRLLREIRSQWPLWAKNLPKLPQLLVEYLQRPALQKSPLTVVHSAAASKSTPKQINSWLINGLWFGLGAFAGAVLCALLVRSILSAVAPELN